MATCASNIRRLGASSSQGNRLQATFSRPYPARIKIKNTSDVADIRGESGIWISAEKYTTMQQVLQLLDDGNSVLRECSYDSAGRIIVVDCFTEFVSVSAIKDPTNVGVVTWTISGQTNIDSFDIQRSATATGIFVSVGTHVFDGNVDYAFVDPNPLKNPDGSVADTNFYRIVAKCQDGTPSTTSEVVQVM